MASSQVKQVPDQIEPMSDRGMAMGRGPRGPHTDIEPLDA